MAKVALLVGVSEYQQGLKPLKSTANDVEAMKRVLQNPDMGGFAEADITLLLNKGRQEMEVAIYELFANRKSDDLLLFYFSGHGVIDNRSKLYLATPTTRKGKGREGLVIPTAVAASFIHERMNDSYSQRMVVILDCCYSGAFAEGLMPKDNSSVNLQTQLGGKGRAIFTSSDSIEYSFQEKGSKLSIYTRYLVEGIETGAADRDEDGWISADELHEYARNKVIEAAPAMTPQFYPVEEGFKILLARAPLGDPKLKYRKEVEAIAREDEGEISYINRCYLEELNNDLGLTEEEILTIETEVLQPYRERLRKLQRYEQVLAKAVKQHCPLREKDIQALKRLQKVLSLRDEDVEAIEARIAPEQSELKPPTIPKPPEREDALQVFEFTTPIVNRRGEEIKRESHSARYFSEDLGNGITLDMVYIPGGTFKMGTEDEEIERLCQKYDVGYFRRERPQHQVTVQTFFMGKFQITQGQWQAIASRDDLKVNLDLESNPSKFKGDDNRPVEQVSWYDVLEFCARLCKLTGRDYRLPSEAEWEYACRAGTTTPFNFGETITGELANYRANSNYTYADEPKGEYREATTPVGQFLPNVFGLYDMQGNVWEWCADPWHKNYQDAPEDGRVWDEKVKNNNRYQNILENLDILLKDDRARVLRGGSWDINANACRSAFRNGNNPDWRNLIYGFRVGRG